MIKKNIPLIGTFLFLILMMHSVESAYAGTITSVRPTLESGGSPITTQQTIRLSLWKDGRLRNSDVSSGVINTAADNYANFQAETTQTPDSEGRLVINLTSLTNFPDISTENFFLMVEYKASGSGVTAYTLYRDDSFGKSDDRYLLIDDGEIISSLLYKNPGMSSTGFILDIDDQVNSGENITLQFGTTLAKTLSWNVDNSRFSFSDDVEIRGNLTVTGTLIVNTISGSTLTLKVPGLQNCDTLDTDGNGKIVCGSDQTGTGVVNLDDAYNNDTGERTIYVDDGDVSWDLTGPNDFIIDTSTGGYVGIGTDAPDVELDVAGTMSGESLQVSGTGSEPILFTDITNGYVGIGTDDPSAKLELFEDGRPDLFTSAFNNFGGSRLVFRRAGGTSGSPSALTFGNSLGGVAAAGYGATGFSDNRASITFFAAENWTDTEQGTEIRFNTTESGTITGYERMRITAEGKVGIGETKPETTFEVGGSMSGITLTVSALKNCDTIDTDGDGVLVCGVDAFGTGTTAGGWTDDGTVVRLTTSTDYVGIGTATPSEKLHVSGSIMLSQDLLPQFPPGTTTGSVASGFTLTLVDSSDHTGEDNSLFCLSSTDCKIAYYDKDNKDLMMADCDNAACTSKTITTVDSGGDVGERPSIYCLSSSDCKIVYYDKSNKDLKMADCDNAACTSKTITTVDSGGDVGERPTIYCLSSTDCKIAYYAKSGKDLKFVDCDNATCSTNTLTTVDSSGDVGEDPSIFCLSSTDCKISYYDKSSKDLKFADCDDATCSTNTLTTVDSGGNVGMANDLYCLSSTDCKISYYDKSSKDLKMADCDDATCSTNTLTTVDSISSNDVGEENAIYCLSSTDCRIAYYDKDSPSKRLLLADCANTTCSTRTITVVDSVTSNDVGDHNDIYCLSSTDCKIAYHDEKDENLMFATSSPASVVLSGAGSNIGSSTLFFNEVYAVKYFGKNTTIFSFDLAEEYPISDTSIEPGDVVSLTGAAPMEVGKTRASYDTHMLGVVSTDPGLLLSDWMNPSDSPQRPVALTGRVPVKVTSENGTIAIGDRLTSSPKPGYAMKATEPGPTLGIALEPLSADKGSIRAFINLEYYSP